MFTSWYPPCFPRTSHFVSPTVAERRLVACIVYSAKSFIWWLRMESHGSWNSKIPSYNMFNMLQILKFPENAAVRSTVDEFFENSCFQLRLGFTWIHCVKGIQGQWPLFSCWSTSTASTWPNQFTCTDWRQAGETKQLQWNLLTYCN